MFWPKVVGKPFPQRPVTVTTVLQCAAISIWHDLQWDGDDQWLYIMLHIVQDLSIASICFIFLPWPGVVKWVPDSGCSCSTYLCYERQWSGWCSSQTLCLWTWCPQSDSLRTVCPQTSLTSALYWWTYGVRWETHKQTDKENMDSDFYRCSIAEPEGAE